MHTTPGGWPVTGTRPRTVTRCAPTARITCTTTGMRSTTTCTTGGRRTITSTAPRITTTAALRTTTGVDRPTGGTAATADQGGGGP